jgi:dTDP-4-amino-4,6-dideoxygalactose transaminase
VDIDARTYCMSPEALDAYLESCATDPATGRPLGARTGTPITAVIPVHLYGQVADMDAILAIAARYNLLVIEDACQAHGAEYQSADGTWRRAGTFGKAAAFSFYPGKNLGALGDGGAVVTNDVGLARRIRSLANHGRADSDRHSHRYRGRNSRLDTLQAGILSAKLPVLDEDNRRRAQVMAAYREQVPAGCVPVAVHQRATSVHHLAVVQVPDRERVLPALDAAGIGWGIHYPIPCHRQPAYAAYAATSAPVAERAAGHIVSLPMSPNLRDDQIARVCDVLRGIVP